MVRILAAALLIGLASPAFAWTHGGADTKVFVVACGNVDDSTAINAAIDSALAVEATGSAAGVYFPSGQCMYKTPHAVMAYPVSFYGDGSMQSIINVDPTFSGDVLSWSDTYFLFGSAHKHGPNVTGLGFYGTKTAIPLQNVLMFYDRVDHLYLNDVFITSFNGKCFSAGRKNVTVAGWLRESSIYSLHAWFCGQAGTAAVEFYSENAGGDSTNTNFIYNLDIVDPVGVGLLLANANTTKAQRYMYFYGLRVEGGSGVSVDDLMQIGDGTSAGGVSAADFYGVMMPGVPSGKAAINFQAPNATAGAKTGQIDFYGLNIGPGAGKGLVIDAGSHLEFHFNSFTVTNTYVTIGATTLGVGGAITFTSNGGNATMAAWTTSIDASMSALVFKPTVEAFP